MVITAPSAENVSSSIWPGGFAVDGVGEVCAELFQVGLVDAASDFLVRREQDFDGAVLDLRVLQQELRRIHDFGEAGLVVGAEQGGAIGRDDVVADLVGQRRIVRRADHLRRIARQDDVSAAIISDELRFDVRTRTVRRRVHMRAEANDGNLLGSVRRNRSVDVTVLVEMGIRDSHLKQFAHQQAAKIFLLLGRRTGGRGRVRLRVDDHIAQETSGHVMCKFDGGR